MQVCSNRQRSKRYVTYIILRTVTCWCNSFHVGVCRCLRVHRHRRCHRDHTTITPLVLLMPCHTKFGLLSKMTSETLCHQPTQFTQFGRLRLPSITSHLPPRQCNGTLISGAMTCNFTSYFHLFLRTKNTPPYNTSEFRVQFFLYLH
jgi:hypothetical protein